MSAKDAVIEMIKKLPDEATVVDIMDELYVRQKIDKGLQQLDAGQGIPHEEALRRLHRF